MSNDVVDGLRTLSVRQLAVSMDSRAFRMSILRDALRWMRHSRSRYATAPLRHVSLRVRSSNFQHCGETLSIPL